jgi:rfaE bifunctional protein kinase chain/domain
MRITEFEKILKRFAGKRIVVLGDMVLDEYVSGSTERISREAPVLILRHERTLELPGGGANPVSNVHSLGGQALPVGLIGDDAAGERLGQIFKAKGLDTSGLVTESGRPTSRKVRVMAGGHNTARQQVIRVDYAPEEGPSKASKKKLLKALEERLAHADGLIVSDYGVGVVGEEILELINGLGKKRPLLVTCVDSRYQLASYRGVSVITPNETEAAPAAGFEEYKDSDLPAIGKKLLKETGAKMALITRGSKGMSLFSGADRIDVPVYGSTQIVDVNGAGDSVASAMTLALVAGARPELAMKVANAAGGVAVMQAGPASVMRDEILDLLKTV